MPPINRQIFLVGQQYQLERLARATRCPSTIARQPAGLHRYDRRRHDRRRERGRADHEVSDRSRTRRQNNGNDFVFFRLGEIYLIKAEAQNEQTAEARPRWFSSTSCVPGCSARSSRASRSTVPRFCRSACSK